MTLKTPFLTLFRSKIEPPTPKIRRKTPFPVKTTPRFVHYKGHTLTRYLPHLSTHKCTTLHVHVCTSYNDLTSMTPSHFSSLDTRAERKKTHPLDAYTRTREMHDFLKTPKNT